MLKIYQRYKLYSFLLHIAVGSVTTTSMGVYQNLYKTGSNLRDCTIIYITKISQLTFWFLIVLDLLFELMQRNAR